MKLSKRMLSLPPYLSTPWSNVVSLRLKSEGGASGTILVIQLSDGALVEVPRLSQETLDQIFAAHAEFLEASEPPTSPPERVPVPAEHLIGVPFRIGAGGPEQMGAVLQHDRAQADAPDLPPEVLSKISGIAQVLGVENVDSLPRAEAGCNCFHCQIARAINRGAETPRDEPAMEEVVSDEDLRFKNWDITPSDQGTNFYRVTNRLDHNEHYTVYLGKPIGCTCGENHCEHIHAALKSAV